MGICVSDVGDERNTSLKSAALTKAYHLNSTSASSVTVHRRRTICANIVLRIAS